jgi:hypothetical protein
VTLCTGWEADSLPQQCGKLDAGGKMNNVFDPDEGPCGLNSVELIEDAVSACEADEHAFSWRWM